MMGMRARRWAGALLGIAVGLSMLAWTWGTWPDVLVDFGGELYVPWRLAQGDVLYRDVAYFTGPLSPYFNAALFRVFGASLSTLVFANLAVLAGIAVLLHGLIERIAGAIAAAAALVVFLTLFAFAQLEFLGNSNYVCPYSHEATHGALLALAALAALARWLEGRRVVWAAAIGLCVGLAFLTKVEVFLAVAAAAGLGLSLGFLADRRGLARAAMTVSACALIPVAAAFAALCTAMDPAGALRGTLGGWPYVVEERITSLAFYRWVMGTDHPEQNLGKLLAWTGRWLAVFAPAAVAALAWRGRATKPGAFVAGLAGAAVAAAVLLALRPSPEGWIEAGRPLPLFALACLAVAFVAAWRTRDDPRDRDRAVLAAGFALYALVLLSKIGLHARINMYGFALAMPSTMLLVAALVGWIPGRIERAGGLGAIFRGFALGALAVAVFAHLSIMETFVSRKTVRVGEGKDAFLADGRGAYVNAAVAAVKKKLAPGDTLAALPEGVMINYLVRAKAPARYINYMPPELLMFGEDAILADFRRSPPDFVAIVHKSTAEYGLPWFGVDYGARLMAFVREKYATGPLIGGEPLRPETSFGVRLLWLRR
jgi:hypothetical protein